MTHSSPTGHGPQQPYPGTYPDVHGYPGPSQPDPRVLAYGQPTPPPAAPKRGASRWLIPLAAFVLGVMLGAALTGGGSSTTAGGATATRTVTAPAKTVTAQVPAAKAPAAAPAASFPGDGTYEVGVDVKPGTYKSAKPASGNCYWARLKGDSGQLADIIANNNSSGPSVVTIKSTDKVFQTTGCEDWVRAR